MRYNTQPPRPQGERETWVHTNVLQISVTGIWIPSSLVNNQERNHSVPETAVHFLNNSFYVKDNVKQAFLFGNRSKLRTKFRVPLSPPNLIVCSSITSASPLYTLVPFTFILFLKKEILKWGLYLLVAYHKILKKNEKASWVWITGWINSLPLRAYKPAPVLNTWHSSNKLSQQLLT